MNAENKEKSMWSMQELDEKSRWAFEHPHDAKERRKIRTDIADEIEECLLKRICSVQNDFFARKMAAICCNMSA